MSNSKQVSAEQDAPQETQPEAPAWAKELCTAANNVLMSAISNGLFAAHHLPNKEVRLVEQWAIRDLHAATKRAVEAMRPVTAEDSEEV